MSVNDIQELNKRIKVAREQYANSRSWDEIVALIDYIETLCSVRNSKLGCIGKILPACKFEASYYEKYLQKTGFAEKRMLRNFVLNKQFHVDYMNEILGGIENDLLSSNDVSSNHSVFSKADFFTIFHDFTKSISLDKLFDKLVTERRLHTFTREAFDDLLAFMTYNPLNKDSDIFVGDLKFDINAMTTLAHEFGHVYDFYNFDESVGKYNRYFYESFFGETISKLFELLFFDYMIKSNIFLDEVKFEQSEFDFINYTYILASYIIGLLPDNLLLDGEYKRLTKKDLYHLVKGYFADKKSLKDFLSECSGINVVTDCTYAYGSILSSFLKDSVDQDGFSNELMDSFMENRSGLFSERFLRQWDMSPDKYIKLRHKQLK